MREAEQQLDTDAYLQEQRWWQPGSLHCEFFYQQMFLCAAMAGKSEHSHTIHWGWRRPSLEQDLGAEPTTMELVGPDLTCQDVEDLYWDVYQLWKLHRRG